jgi:hypothetical protein
MIRGCVIIRTYTEWARIIYDINLFFHLNFKKCFHPFKEKNKKTNFSCNSKAINYNF